MYQVNLEQTNKIFFLGIGGIGMSALARAMHHAGKIVLGSDISENKIVDDLRNEGYLIHIGQHIEDIPSDVNLIVYSEAIEDFHPEFLGKLRSRFFVPIISYPQMLGVFSQDKFTIAIAGTHGKTTTTGMIGTMLVDTKQSPTVIVGSILAREQSNFIAGTSDVIVVESCEYKRSFLNVNPKILVITNIERDHMDYYKDLEDIKNAFHELALKVPETGFIITDTHNETVADVMKDVRAKVIDYRDYRDENLKLKVPSDYNISNAACALAVADILKLDGINARLSLENFQGTWRRFEYKGKTKHDALVYDDYAHHPTEISSMLTAMHIMFPEKDIIAIFEPHLFSRTKSLLSEFATSFMLAHDVVLVPIYHAREEDDGSISSEMLGQKIQEHNARVFVARNYDQALEHIEMHNTSNTIIVTVGAGPVYEIGERFLKTH